MSFREKLLAAQKASAPPLRSAEKDDSPSKAENTPKEKRIWTLEQEAFLHESSDGRIFLSALAGTGKTSSLLEYARRRPHEKWSFLAFNSSVALSVEKKAPPNVKVSTVHALAYARFGKHLHKKLRTDFSASDFAGALPSCSSREIPLIVAFFERWLHSFEILDAFCEKLPLFSEAKNFSYTQEEWSQMFRTLWSHCLSESSSFGITHDVYMKRLSQSDFAWPSRLMLDEAQDWNGALLGHLEKSSFSGVVCGDPYQSIYSFRHATARLHPRNMDVHCWLTQSFRQAFPFDTMVNALLRKMRSPKMLLPRPSSSPALIHNDEQSENNVRSFAPSVILAYDNKTIEDMRLRFPDIAAMTIHASKGLEFERVWIADHDFPVFLTDREKLALMYVAITRPRSALRFPSGWSTFLNGDNHIAGASCLNTILRADDSDVAFETFF